MRFFILIVAFLAFSCNRKAQEDSAYNRDQLRADKQSKIFVNSTPKSFDVDLRNRKSSINVSSIISADHKVIKLETTDDCLIGEISKVIIKGDQIFVFDGKVAKSLFCFNLQGKYLFKVGIIGDGPGEMDTPRDFDVTDNHIYIIDRKCQVFTFKLSGEYKSTFRLPFLTTQICASNDTSIFYYTGSITDNFRHYLTQVNGSNVSSFSFPIQSDVVGGYDIPQAFHKHNDQILFVKFLCDTIFRIADNKVVPSYVLNFQGEYSNIIFQDKKELDQVYLDPDTYGKLFNMHMAETSQNLFFLSSSRGLNCHFISKATGKHIFTSNVIDDYLLGGLSPMFPVGSHEDYFIYPITMGYMFKNYEKGLDDFQKKGMEKDFISRYSELRALYEQSDKDDNPSLLLSGINPNLYEE